MQYPKLSHPLKITITALLAIILIGVGFLVGNGSSISSRITRFGLENIGELATQAGYFTNVQSISNSQNFFGIDVPLTTNNYVFSYDGVVKAGIDFASIDYTIDNSNRIITIRLPKASVLSVDVDENSLELYNAQNNIFTPLNFEDIQQARVSMRKEIEEQAVENGLLQHAESNAETLLKGFFSAQNDLAQYEVCFE